MAKFKLLIYDLDGTLVDTAEDITRSINFMLAEFDKPKRDRKEVSAFVGLGVFHLVQNVLGEKDPKVVEKAIKIYRGHYAKHMLDTSRLFPGAAEFLKHFRSRKQAVITNKPNPYSKDILIGLGVADYFVEIIAGDSPYPKNPIPRDFWPSLSAKRYCPARPCLSGTARWMCKPVKGPGRPRLYSLMDFRGWMK